MPTTISNERQMLREPPRIPRPPHTCAARAARRTTANEGSSPAAALRPSRRFAPAAPAGQRTRWPMPSRRDSEQRWSIGESRNEAHRIRGHYESGYLVGSTTSRREAPRLSSLTLKATSRARHPGLLGRRRKISPSTRAEARAGDFRAAMPSSGPHSIDARLLCCQGLVTTNHGIGRRHPALGSGCSVRLWPDERLLTRREG